MHSSLQLHEQKEQNTLCLKVEKILQESPALEGHNKYCRSSILQRKLDEARHILRMENQDRQKLGERVKLIFVFIHWPNKFIAPTWNNINPTWATSTPSNSPNKLTSLAFQANQLNWSSKELLTG